MTVFWQGLMVGASLIVAIGAQNAYLIKQGLSKQHIFIVAGICFLGDVVLMSFSILGAGSMFARTPWVSATLAMVGAGFLLIYAYRCFKSAYTGQSAIHLQDGAVTQTAKQAALMAFALTFLNPHVYLDTILIIGGIAGTLSLQQKHWFLAGALTTSFIWFFGVGYGARWLLPLFSQARTWRILDGLIGTLMLCLALGLVDYALSLWQTIVF